MLLVYITACNVGHGLHSKAYIEAKSACSASLAQLMRVPSTASRASARADAASIMDESFFSLGL